MTEPNSATSSQAAQLLVSVQNAAEAERALSGGADWIDIKSPAAGALGMARLDDMLGVICTIANRLPVTAALGELLDWLILEEMDHLPLSGLAAVKVGLSQCAGMPDWPEHWARLASKLPAGVPLVAVHYADFQTCGSPSAERLLEAAGANDCRLLLVDTCRKSNGNLFDYLSPHQLSELYHQAHNRGLQCVAAGSLGAGDFETAIRAGADIIAVRGAACSRGVRNAPLCTQRVQELSRMIKSIGK